MHDLLQYPVQWVLQEALQEIQEDVHHGEEQV
jgi:hypothetical protein